MGLDHPYHLDAINPIKNFIRKLPPFIEKNKEFPKVFFFITYGGVSSGIALLKMANLLHLKGYSILGALKLTAPHFYEVNEDFPNKSSIPIINEYVKVLKKRIQQNVPWEEMKEKLDYQLYYVKISRIFSRVLGKYRVPKIYLDKEKCNKCKLCGKSCPVKAITFDPFPIRNENCIHCYNCVNVCPTKAMHADLEKMKKTVQTNKKKVKEKELNAWY